MRDSHLLTIMSLSAEFSSAIKQRQDSTPHLELLSMDCGPSDCPVGERLELSMEFTLDRSLGEASWEIKVSLGTVRCSFTEKHKTCRLYVAKVKPMFPL